MKKLLTFLLLAITGLSACKKSNNGGKQPQICTDVFVSINMVFTNNDGSHVAISNIEAVNLRTNKAINRPAPSPAVDYVPGVVLLTNDSFKNDFSAEGDEIKVIAKSDKTGQVKSAIVKISGGNNCHVAKLSGPDEVAFD